MVELHPPNCTSNKREGDNLEDHDKIFSVSHGVFLWSLFALGIDCDLCADKVRLAFWLVQAWHLQNQYNIMYTYYYCLAGYPKEFCGFERVLLFMSYLATYLLCNMPYVDDVKKISLHYLTIYPTNKPVSDSSPNASYKNYHISSLWAFSFTYLLMILTHPGKNGMAHLPPT